MPLLYCNIAISAHYRIYSPHFFSVGNIHIYEQPVRFLLNLIAEVSICYALVGIHMRQRYYLSYGWMLCTENAIIVKKNVMINILTVFPYTCHLGFDTFQKLNRTFCIPV